MPKIRFARDYVVADDAQTKYERGKEYDLPERSCKHFENRGAAERVSTKARSSTQADVGPAAKK